MEEIPGRIEREKKGPEMESWGTPTSRTRERNHKGNKEESSEKQEEKWGGWEGGNGALQVKGQRFQVRESVPLCQMLQRAVK